MADQTKQGTHPSFPVLILVFFFWGFVAASNSIFIPFCKAHFELTQLESQLIDFAFYGAYFIGSLLLYLFSVIRGVDILNKIGYQKGIIYGLLISVVGAAALIGAVNIGNGMAEKSNAFYLILGAFFIVALGFSLQQTAANPFAILLGDPSKGTHRLNLAGGINSFGTTIGPIIVSMLLFGSAQGGDASKTDISKINTLYILLIVLFLVAAAIFAFAKMPKTTADEPFENSTHASKALLGITAMFVLILVGIALKKELPFFITGIVGILAILFYAKGSSQKNGDGWGAMKYPQLVLGMIAIFVYVGVEVTVASNMGALLKHPGFLTPEGLSESQLDPFISLFWGSLMIGRWAGAITVFNVSKATRKLLFVIVPFIAYGVILGANAWKGNDITQLYPYAGVLVIQIIGFFAGQEKPAKTLMIFGLLGMAAMIIGLCTTGYVATFAFVSGGLFCSVMWPSIFSLAIAGLGKYTSQASSFLVMMILGGSLIPPVQGGLADTPLGIHASYIIPVLCFAYLAFFAFRVKTILKSQGIDYESAISSGH
ncbi:sugar MFS transporter [Chitinophaga agrisoli]|uniref:Sugar MFS transporter n=1 Tax=Chitinophaga agrisoli TaxID=2607653 RepID=A0A5B2VMA3_9BACT|nr:sugar MFS transporter [Chitinophaga agrisoli]KAA2240151.1 sugar MFS transporter [Chitinophaga agrisoli]